MSKALDKRAREVILMRMSERGEMAVEEVMDLVRPHYDFDPLVSKEREIRRKSNRLIAQLKDEQGVRTCFGYTDSNGQSKYINVDKTENVEALVAITSQINSNYNGLKKTAKKLNSRLLELVGQMKMFDQDEQTS